MNKRDNLIELLDRVAENYDVQPASKILYYTKSTLNSSRINIYIPVGAPSYPQTMEVSNGEELKGYCQIQSGLLLPEEVVKYLKLPFQEYTIPDKVCIRDCLDSEDLPPIFNH